MTISAEKPMNLGDALIGHGYLTQEQLDEALDHQQRIGKTRLLGEILVDMSYCSEDQIFECLAAGYGVPYARLEPRLMDPNVVELLPRDYMERNLVLPLFCIRDVLTVAVSEPSNLFLIDELRHVTGNEIQIVAATLKDIRRMFASLPDAKVFVIDEKILVTGSLNFSNNADESNDENVVVITNSDIAAQYIKEFERRWGEAKEPDKADMNCK